MNTETTTTANTLDLTDNGRIFMLGWLRSVLKDNGTPVTIDDWNRAYEAAAQYVAETA